MFFETAILNGTIVESGKRYKGNIYISDGKIRLISDSEIIYGSEKTINAEGLFVFPGFIDTHVHSRDGGAPHKEDFYHSTMAAAAGGITCIFEMPNSIPATIDRESFETQVENYSSKAIIDFGIWGLCVGYLNNDKLSEIAEAGCIGFKFFWGYAIKKDTYGLVYNYDPEDKNIVPAYDNGDVYEIFENVSKTGKVLAIHAEDASLINKLTQRYKDCKVDDYDSLLKARPNIAEEIVVNTALNFSKVTGTKLHILHLSSGGSIDLIERAKETGVDVSCETCPHYLLLSNDDYKKIGNAMKIFPPVKYDSDRALLWQGIADGVFTNICSDHAPHTEQEKNGSLWEVPAGACGVETTVPLMLDCVNRGKLTLEELGELMSSGPAKRFGIFPQKGSLMPGTDADITIVDLEKDFCINASELKSVAKVTPYDGRKGKGMPVFTIVRGNIVMRNGDVEPVVRGKLIKPLKY